MRIQTKIFIKIIICIQVSMAFLLGNSRISHIVQILCFTTIVTLTVIELIKSERKYRNRDEFDKMLKKFEEEHENRS
jgi:hypothetical protein